MTLVLELPKELEADLSAEAARHGLALQEYALQLLRRVPHEQPIKMGVDLVEYWQKEGLIGLRTDIADSQEHARSIRTVAEKR